MLVVLVMGLLMMSPLAANAATNQLSGAVSYDPVQCPGPPPGYEDFTSYPGALLTGSLEGCLYVKIGTSKLIPSGVYLESGQEVFIGSLNDGPEGTFTTTYKFESKWDPDVTTGVELHGRCQHPIAEGSAARLSRRARCAVSTDGREEAAGSSRLDESGQQLEQEYQVGDGADQFVRLFR